MSWGTAPDSMSWATMPRYAASSSAIATLSQVLRFNAFTARRPGLTTGVRGYTGTTPAGATPSLIRIGLYQLNASDGGTLIASTPNDTALFNVANTQWTKAWSVAVTLAPAQRYALGVLVVTAAAAPTLVGAVQANIMQNENLIFPFGAALIPSQSDLPGSFAAGSLLSSINWSYLTCT